MKKETDFPISEEKRLELINNLQELIDLEKIKDTMTLKELVYFKVKRAAYCWGEIPISVIGEIELESIADEIMASIQLAIINAYDYARTICDIESGEEYYNKNYNNKTKKQMKDLKTIITEKIGEASMCLSETKKCVLTDSASNRLVDEIMEAVIESMEPHISILEPGSESAVLFEAAKPLMKLLNDKYHPHCTIIVNHGNVQVYEGICSTGFTNEFMND